MQSSGNFFEMNVGYFFTILYLLYTVFSPGPVHCNFMSVDKFMQEFQIMNALSLIRTLCVMNC
jgi:hypothetical protein